MLADGSGLSSHDAKTIAAYKARIMQNQDLAQIAYLKVFKPRGRKINPLRGKDMLANSELTFPIAAICGANG